jgi:subtilisin family serine protease
MTGRPVREARPLLWIALVLAGTAAGMAAPPAHAADGVATLPDGTLWLAQAEGGEGAAQADVSPGAAILIELGRLEAHVLAAERLFYAGAGAEAQALASQPEAEFLPDLRGTLEAAGLPDPTPHVDALIAALGTGEGVEAGVDLSLSAIREAHFMLEPSARDRYDAIAALVRDAGEEYGEAVEGGEVVDLAALEETRGYLDAASALVPQDEVGAKVQALIDGARIVFPGVATGGAFTPDAAILYGAAAQIEIAAIGVE